MERVDTDVRPSTSSCIPSTSISCVISDVGSGSYEPAQGQTLPTPATSYGAIQGR